MVYEEKKTRSDNALGMLRGRKWHTMPASEYLWLRLSGEDGDEPWSLEVAAAELYKKLKRKVTPMTISRWYKKQRAFRRANENYQTVLDSTLRFFEERTKEDVSIAEMVDAQMIFMIGRIHSEDGTEEAVAAMKAFTNLRKALTDERKLTQRITEYEESVQKLKDRIATLHKALKKHGLDEGDIDELNRKTVEAVDAMVLANSVR